jgi:hypothetical protein
MTTRTLAGFTMLSLLAAAATGCHGTRIDEAEKVKLSPVALRRAQTCPQLEQMIKADALAKMNARIDRTIWALTSSANGRGEVYASDQQASGGAATPMPSGAAGAGGGGGSTGSAGSDPTASQHSETNTQVAGVDEADIVKTDGKYIYLLHGQSFLVLNAWPATDLAQASSFAIEGQPLEMYVDAGRVVVFSTVDGTPAYQGAGVSPREAYSDDWGYSGGFDGPAPSVGPAAPGSSGAYPGYYGSPLTKMTVLAVAGTQPSLVREVYFEGTYTTSRRVGRYVRAVVSGGAHGPALSYYPSNGGYYGGNVTDAVAAYEGLRASNAAKIGATPLAGWLPYHIEKKAGGYELVLASCDQYWVPDAASTSYGLTQVRSIDLDAPEAPVQGASIMGRADVVYSSADAMYVASRAWLASSSPWAWAEVYGPSAGIAAPSTVVSLGWTLVHKFDLTADPARPGYVATGAVPGSPNDQFSLDEAGGDLRIATTDDRRIGYQSERVNHLFVLRPARDGLQMIGSAGDLARGERIYSVRYVGTRGYVVTFRQVDPLFVIDLANPTTPKVLGELKIPGFSTYMHPLDDGHLLTIGQENGQLMLQVFDVTNPTAPALAHKYVFSGPNEHGTSEAQNNHKAFTYFAPYKALAFPFIGHGGSGGTYSALELFRVDVTEGIKKLGAVDHSAFFKTASSGWCGGYYDAAVRRGVFLDDFVYSISYGGVVVNQLADLAKPVATLPLAAPMSDAYGCKGY